jgi:hypothetical protein
MNFYKKFLSKKLRFAILRFFKFVPDKQMIQFQYWMKLHRKLNLKNPRRYTEKIQYYKLYYRNEKMPICVDKYRVREYLESKGLSNILVKLYGVYEKVEDIPFETLPNKFVLKTSNGSGTNIICRDKNKLSKEKILANVNKFLKQSSASAGREWAYAMGVPKVIIEELLEDHNSLDGAIWDYKYLCFNGKPEYVVLDIDRFTNHKRNIYDVEWIDQHVISDHPCIDDRTFEKPKNYERMVEIATKLSEDFPAVRVDLYNINGRIYFGELTFFPWSGYVQFNPDSFDFEMGKKFRLPEKES